MRHIIVGASIAGLSAAGKIKNLSPRDEVIVISEEAAKPYGKMTLPYLLSGEVDVCESYLSVPEGITLLLNRRVVAVDPVNKFVKMDDGEEIAYDKLLIAAGARAYIPEIPGCELPSVFSVRDLEDVENIKDRIERSDEKRVILSGAGLVNIEVGDALVKIGVPVTYVIRSNRVLSQIIDEDASKMIEEELAKSGVELLKGESIEEVEERGGVTFARLESGKVLKGSCIIFGKGVRPNVDFLKDTGVEINRGILVNEFLETGVKDVYAAGDVTEVKDIVYGDKRMHALWPVAMEQGKIAGMNMVGRENRYGGDVSRNILTAFGKTIFTGGVSKEDKFDVYKKVEDGEYKKVILEDGKLRGFIFIGEVESPGVYLYAMRNEVDVGGLKDLLIHGILSHSDLHPSVRRVVMR